ncbi:MAG: DegT/DnrJ/EryC1/StrS family aminotransferase [Candidatus Omnitrophica bacterium]|nr:DegT/DnrJ/EryC1/StrS family aminotransferase [Candidatus Omnitrophota bacterium]MDD5429555.1 DegT/DnrJ/EryC1/StrS family aminotransferase [Candidatus Omnitrophota bacterium]
MNIPILDLKKEYTFLKNDITAQLKSCFKNQQWILGNKVEAFEKRAAKYLKVKYAVGVASGTDALILSLEALALKLRSKPQFSAKDEIITTPFTFLATAESIVRSGATPVFVDINPDTFNIDTLSIKKAITKNTVGIIPVHLYGQACEMDEISKIAKEYNLFVVEDAAQAFGAEYKNRKVGTFGNCGAFSFFPSKNLGAFGDAGLISTNDGRLSELLKMLRNHGQVRQYDASFIGHNSRLDAIQAAVLTAKLKYIDKFNTLRKKVAYEYDKVFSDVKEIEAPFSPDYNRHIYHLYTIKVASNRNKLLKHLNSAGVQARIYYPVPLYEMKAFKSAIFKKPYKGAEDALSKVISLPIYPFLAKGQIKHIIKSIVDFFA